MARAGQRQLERRQLASRDGIVERALTNVSIRCRIFLVEVTVCDFIELVHGVNVAPVRRDTTVRDTPELQFWEKNRPIWC